MSDTYKLEKALAGTGAAVNFEGTWINGLGSTAEIHQAGEILTGEYISTKSGGGHSTKGALTGHVDGDLISFTVHWYDFQAITAWVGQLDQAGSQIKTLWQMTSQVDLGEEWASINAGSDIFTLKP